jgi:SAM-dependent methyltransferase
VYECSKAVMRRLHDSRFATRWFIGDGIDVGSGPDHVGSHREFFPGMRSCKPWDMPDGDAQILHGVADNSFDFVHSSHCLEHMVEPFIALGNWIRVLKPGGHLILLVPDEDLYEQGVFPSTFNPDHKWTFTVSKSKSWSPRSISVVDLVRRFSDLIQVIKIELLDATFRFNAPRIDQTLTPISESAIELIARKWSARDLNAGARAPPMASP